MERFKRKLEELKKEFADKFIVHNENIHFLAESKEEANEIGEAEFRIGKFEIIEPVKKTAKPKAKEEDKK